MAGFAAGAAAQFLEPGGRYQGCLNSAKTDPAEGLKLADDWRAAGGGFPAEHCAGVALIGLKRYPEAARRLEALAGAMMVDDSGLRAGALEQAGQAWLLASRPREAEADFNAALSFNPQDPDLLIDRAQAHADAKEFGRAIEDLDRALSVAPKRAEALIFRASAERQTNLLDRALADVEAALALTPDAVPGLLERGNIRSLKGDAAGARADWQRILTLDAGSDAAKAAKDNLAHQAAETPKK
jgi:tetratricopeptide (TPR) repeat protein